MTPGKSDEIEVLVKEAEQKLGAAKVEGGSLGSLPAYILIGDPGTTKTSVMMHSGLEPELIAGQLYEGGNVASTRTANLWFSRRALFVEAGGRLLADAANWQKLVKKLSPKAGAPRAAIVCFDCENFTKPGAQEAVANAARNLRARLDEISQAMGINLPVYVLFTKLDRLPFFTEYVRNLSNDEATQVLGVTLPLLGSRSQGVYGEEETARLTGNFERLFRSLADGRPEFLSRETDASKLPPAYEFPREFRKIRPAAVQFLVDLCRPSHLTAGPFLRGFYFTGVRPVIVNEAAPVALAAQQQPGFGQAAGATGIFNARAQQAQQAAPQPMGGTRKVPQWLFLSHLFNDVLLADKAALGASGSSTKKSGLKRILFIAAAAICLLLSLMFTISFFNNHALESRVREAALGISAGESTGADLASTDSLRKLDTLRQAIEQLVKYRKDGPPLSYRWFLFVGDDLYPEARKVYFDRFKQLLFAQTHGGIQAALQGAPASQCPDYSPTYDALKAYLITTSHHDKSTRLFLTPVLNRFWTAGRTVDPERQQLATKQFDFYAEELKEQNPYPLEADGRTVEKVRHSLALCAGAERVYAFMLAEAKKSNPPINFNRQFPGSAQVVIESHEVPGEFSKGGWAFMKDAIAHADRYFAGEQWVLGEQATANIDRAKLEQELKSRYYGDFVKEWRAYVKGANVVRYASLKDASQKLQTISGNQSPLLALFCVASQNTAVDDPNVANLFQPVQTVVPPACADKYIAPPNQNYMGALVTLQTSLEGIADQQPTDAAAAATLTNATQAKVTTRQMAQAFRLDSETHLEAAAQKLLEDPIVYAEALLRTLGPAELNGKGKALCAQIHPALAKYPFAPNAQVQVTPADIDSVFKPKEGALWQFVDTNLQKAVVRQGPQFVPNPSAGVTINSAFLGFLNRAAAFTDAAYAGGAPSAHFTYKVRPVMSADTLSVKLVIDGQTADFTGASPAPHEFRWPGPSSGALMTAKFKAGSEFTYPTYDGVFQFIGDADKNDGQIIQMKLKGGRQGREVTNPATGQPVVVSIEINANPPIFAKGYFAGLSCVADIARP